MASCYKLLYHSDVMVPRLHPIWNWALWLHWTEHKDSCCEYKTIMICTTQWWSPQFWAWEYLADNLTLNLGEEWSNLLMKKSKLEHKGPSSIFNIKFELSRDSMTICLTKWYVNLFWSFFCGETAPKISDSHVVILALVLRQIMCSGLSWGLAYLSSHCPWAEPISRHSQAWHPSPENP